MIRYLDLLDKETRILIPSTSGNKKSTDSWLIEVLQRIGHTNISSYRYRVSDRGRTVPFDPNRLYKFNTISKKDINELLFEGKTRQVMTINVKEEGATAAKRITETAEARYKAHRSTLAVLTANLLNIFEGLHGYKNFNFPENKLTVGKQTQKLTKAFRTWLKSLGSLHDTKIEEISQYVSEFWSKKSSTIKVTWSTDPGDLIRQSYGNSWHSCHWEMISPDYAKTGNVFGTRGPSSLPWVEHALDLTSTILLIESEDMKVSSRRMLHIDTLGKRFTFGREYPRRWSSNKELEVMKVVREKLIGLGFKEHDFKIKSRYWMQEKKSNSLSYFYSDFASYIYTKQTTTLEGAHSRLGISNAERKIFFNNKKGVKEWLLNKQLLETRE